MPSSIKPPPALTTAQKTPLPLIVGVSVSVILLILGKVGMLQPFEYLFGRVYRVFLPAQSMVVEQLSRPWRWAQFVNNGANQITALEQQLAERTTQIAEAEFLQKENQELRQQLESLSTQDIKEQQSVLTVPARVVTASGMIGIDQGDAAGIRIGDVVFSRGYVIGRINKVDEFFSDFTLINQGNTPIVVKTLSGIVGVLTGDNGQLILTEISVDQELKIGDKIFTVGSVDQGIPPGLMAGEVSEVNQIPQSATKQIIIAQPGNEQLPSLVVIRRYEGK